MNLGVEGNLIEGEAAVFRKFSSASCRRRNDNVVVIALSPYTGCGSFRHGWWLAELGTDKNPIRFQHGISVYDRRPPGSGRTGGRSSSARARTSCSPGRGYRCACRTSTMHVAFLFVWPMRRLAWETLLGFSIVAVFLFLRIYCRSSLTPTCCDTR
jgi:hypothetical protein